jgi:hypothetical protein
MIKKIGLGLVTLLLSICAYAGMWKLVNQQYDGNKVYCTYQLDGTTIQKTIQGMGICQQLIYEN